jgi:hypothetical protein
MRWCVCLVLLTGIGLNSPVISAAQKSTANAKTPATTPGPKQKVQNPGELERDVAFNLLEEAYGTSRELSSELRIPLLSQICSSASFLSATSRAVFTLRSHRTPRTAAVKGSHTTVELTKKQKDRVKDWSEELYLLGSEFPAGSEIRGAAELAATRAMVKIDIDRALEMFDAVNTEGDPFFDSRAGLEYQLFDSLYRAKGEAVLPDLRRKALALGDQGAYPYEAISNLIQQVNGHPQIVRQFFSDAITCYRRSNSPIQKSFAILGMLSKPIRDQLELWQVQDAAQELAAQAKRYVQSQREMQSQGQTTAPGGGMIVNSIRASLKQFAPEIASTIPDPPPFIPSTHSPATVAAKLPQAPVPDESLKALHDAFEANRTAIMAMNEDEIHDGPEMRETIEKAVTQGAEFVL